MKIYYAHHIWKYGTPIEDYELSLIEKQFPNAEIINPKNVVDQQMTSEQIMDECFYQLDGCDAVAFSGISGVVGKGVYDEISRASDQFKPIYYIHNNTLIPFRFNFRTIKNSETKRIYAIVNFDEMEDGK